MTLLIRWGWMLVLALFVPVSLPAGGGTEPRKSSQILRRDPRSGCDPLIGLSSFSLRASPSSIAPALCNFESGTPLRVLRSWESEDGKSWLMVQIASGNLARLNCSLRRGWVNV